MVYLLILPIMRHSAQFYFNFKFVFMCFLLAYFNCPNSPTPIPNSHSTTRSCERTIEKKVNVDIFKILEMKIQLLFLCVILFLYINPDTLYVRFIPFNTPTNTLCTFFSRKSLPCKKYCLLLLILTFLMIFEYHLIVLLPKEFFEIKLVTKRRLSLINRFVRLSKHTIFVISLYVSKRLILRFH